MNDAELKRAREAYSYIPAKLTRAREGGDSAIQWKDLRLSSSVPPSDWYSDVTKRQSFSSMELDNFHSALLASDDPQELLHGLLSVVFWGYVSGTDGNIREARALKRTCWHLRGKANSSPQMPLEIILHLENARELLEEAQIGDALIEVMRIKFLGMAFGSKVLAFMNSKVAAVYDEVISLRLEGHSNPTLSRLANGVKLTRKVDQANLYADWCGWCFEKARTINAAGVLWRDWNGADNAWRAVDAERAFYALGR
ncbi:hypothetical protein [Bradyrhizobium japonicum]|uniref:8-oxoguanine DNA glycosylase OGG fold protein n=1 Tax=Bradyrhizobium japonicum TaxID=375 RepID=UPI00339716E7